MIEDTAIPASDWCQRVIEAHRAPYEVIGGVVAHLSKRPLNWAVFLHDFGRYQPPVNEGATDWLTDVNVSYKRSVLERTRAVWGERYNEAVLHWALRDQGATLWLSPNITVAQDRGALSVYGLVAERYHWGRLFGSVRRRYRPGSRLVYAVATPLIPALLLGRTLKKCLSTERGLRTWLRSLFPNLLLTVVWQAGEVIGYATGREL